MSFRNFLELVNRNRLSTFAAIFITTYFATYPLSRIQTTDMPTVNERISQSKYDNELQEKQIKFK